uniref:Bm1110 n=1 Tax=Brugia malayi TaxID=6279 RepID=A0A0J9Y6F1_BRUMA|nr:Bm1110 [Brugia malayi]
MFVWVSIWSRVWLRNRRNNGGLGLLGLALNLVGK